MRACVECGAALHAKDRGQTTGKCIPCYRKSVKRIIPMPNEKDLTANIERGSIRLHQALWREHPEILNRLSMQSGEVVRACA